MEIYYIHNSISGFELIKTPQLTAKKSPKLTFKSTKMRNNNNQSTMRDDKKEEHNAYQKD